MSSTPNHEPNLADLTYSSFPSTSECPGTQNSLVLLAFFIEFPFTRTDVVSGDMEALISVQK